MSVKIAQLKKADMAAVRDLKYLLKQLRDEPSDSDLRSIEDAGSLSDLRNIMNDKNAVMIVAQDGKRIIGVATLYVITKIGRKNGTVEDVVVDSAYRGRGLGEKIVRKIIAVARKKKIRKLYLTSRPHRVAAHHLYQKLGFKLRETNPYTLRL